MSRIRLLPTNSGRVPGPCRKPLVPFRESVGLIGPPPATRLGPQDIDAQLDVLLAERVPIVGFTFGVPAAELVARVHASGAVVMGTATTVAEGRALQDAGVDVVVGQGAEAGRHRASFLATADPVGLVALVPALVDALDVPVIASGGIMDGRGIVAALALGAGAVQLGTAFLCCAEAGTNPAYRAALAAAGEDATVLTDRFSGKPARGIRNAFVDTFPAIPVPRYPVMNALTCELRAHAAQQGRADLLSLRAGQGVGHGRERPAGQLVAELTTEVDQVLARWT